MTITIYHNPACGTSRNTLGLIRNSGEEPEVSSTENAAEPGGTDRASFSAWEYRCATCCAGKARLIDELGLDDPALTAMTSCSTP